METNEYSQIHCRDTQISVRHLDGGCQNHIVLAGRERVSKQHAEKRLNSDVKWELLLPDAPASPEATAGELEQVPGLHEVKDSWEM